MLPWLTAGLLSERTFSGWLRFDPFPLHQDVQYYQATTQQVWPGMAVGLAGPKASQHCHQQVGLEQRQSGFSLSGGRAQSNCINYIDRWDERVGKILDRR